MRSMRWMILVGCLLMAGASLAGQLSPQLEAQFAQKQDDSPVKVLVVLRDRVDIQALDWNLHEQRVDLATRHVTVIETLKDAARGSQADLLVNLSSRQGRGEVTQFKAHWLINGIMVTATESVIREIAARDDVEVVEPNLVPELIEPVSRGASEDGRSVGITPGVVHIGARRVWDELGVRGEGALIGSNDTGVAGNHPALANRWRGLHAPWQHCWLDVLGTNTQFPSDGNGHGTHCTGTMTGLATNDTIGVAPGAEWIASNVINQGAGGGFDGDMIDCFEWFADPDGNPNTLDDVPDVVQNSWGVNEGFGYPDCDSRWWSVMDACEAAGPVIVFAAGNEGSGASTLRSPADRASTIYNCFSVGATGHSSPFTIAGFSSRGPAGPNCGPLENRVKPEVSAPGVSIYSAAPGGGYQSMDGTSMACPHVSGVVALMRSANPNVDVITIKQVLMSTAHDLGAAGEDNTYGHGFIDAYQAVLAVMGGLGSLEGTVIDASTGLPVSGVHIAVEGAFQSDVTDADGAFTLTLQVGEHTLRASAFGYEVVSSIVVIAENQVTTVELALPQLPRYTISGIVIQPDGQPAANAIVGVDAPISSVTADAQGHYSLAVPAAAEYYLTATSGTGGYIDLHVPATQDLDLDLHLRTVGGEGFESGDMTALPWILTGNASWYAQSSMVHAGSFAARSGAIGNTAISQMQLFIICPTAGEIRFWYRTSTQANDTFTFTLDNTQLGTWSGEGEWAQAAFPITAGSHSLRFRFYKDNAGSAGQDCVWVDDITFPGGGTVAPNLVIAPAGASVTMNEPGQVMVPIHVFNQGSASLIWSAAESSPWLQVNPSFGVVAPGNFQTLNLAVNSAGLPDGLHQTTVALTSNDPDLPALSIPVQLQLGGTTAVEGQTPAAFGLTGAVPNPFNPMTTLHFNLPANQQAKLAVYDVQGRLVRTLVNAVLPAGPGEVRWDGLDQSGRGVSSGTYFARLTTAGQTSVKTLTLVR